MTRPNIPARLSFDSRGINDASCEYAPRLFTITPGRTNDPQTQALGHAFAAVPALLEALEAMLEAYAPYHQQTVDHRGNEDSLHSSVKKVRAACAVLASALWEYYRSDIPPETEKRGDALRAKFKRMFGARIQKRWFD